ncbi:MAG: DivIVA domain-containing protein [Actinomycetia bacterium]|nr:DivIVA domain-containing protein [Actinomycetes bacterium]
MVWVLLVAVAVVLIAAFLALLAGRVPVDRLAEPVHSTPQIQLPADAGASEVDNLRFDTALRGYRMDQVDQALDQLRDRLAELEDELAEVRRSAAPSGLDPLPDPRV